MTIGTMMGMTTGMTTINIFRNSFKTPILPDGIRILSM